jgi:hypothetical protein
LRKTAGAVEKAALDWNSQGVRRCCPPKKTERKKPEKQAVKRLAANSTRWRSFTDVLCSSRSCRN